MQLLGELIRITQSVPLRTSKKLPYDGLTVFLGIVPTIHAFKN